MQKSSICIEIWFFFVYSVFRGISFVKSKLISFFSKKMIENAFRQNERFSPILLGIYNVPHILQSFPQGQPIAFRNSPTGRVLYIGKGGLLNHN